MFVTVSKTEMFIFTGGVRKLLSDFERSLKTKKFSVQKDPSISREEVSVSTLPIFVNELALLRKVCKFISKKEV